MLTKKRVIEIVNKGPYAPLSNYYVVSCADTAPFNTVIQAYYYFMAQADRTKQDAIMKTYKIHDIMEILGPELYSRCSIIPQFNVYYDYEKTYTMLWAVIALKLHNNRNFQRILLATGEAEIYMMCGTDSVLGVGKGRRGYNISGLILMKLRDYYHQEYILNNIITAVDLKSQFNERNDEMNKTMEQFDNTTDYEFCISPINDIRNYLFSPIESEKIV